MRQMRQLLFSSLLVAPLVLGIAVVCAGSTEADNQLPGREVNSIEASMINGGGCGGTSTACTAAGCTGNQHLLSAKTTGRSTTGGGCSSNCSSDSYSSTGCLTGS